MNKTYELLEGLLAEAKELDFNKDSNLDIIRKRSEMIVKKAFGKDTEYVDKLTKIRFSPSVTYSGMSPSVYYSKFQNGKQQLVNLINVMLEDLSLSEIINTEDNSFKSTPLLLKNIFIVHGHNEEMKQSTARFLEKVGLTPIILHERPNKGRTIIEKFTDYSDVNFAVILLSADDVAFPKTESLESAKFRARQNVILELGFFLGKIGRENVVVLHEQVENFEIPSDYQGILYVPYDNSGNWKLSIAKELKAIGYEIDGNKLLE